MTFRRTVGAALAGLLAGVLVAAAPAGAQVTAMRLTDGFARLPRGASYGDGARFGAWQVGFTGYGSVRTELDGTTPTLALSPKASTRADETHATLVRTQQEFGDLDLRLRVKTVRQLRTGSTPNPWETAWVLWHYTDNTHFYSVVLKTNGWELGKEDPAYPGAQRFLATGDDVGFAPGTWHDVHVTQVGNVLSLRVDGRLLASFTDTERPYVRGAVALYDEDAHTRFTGVAVTPVNR